MKQFLRAFSLLIPLLWSVQSQAESVFTTAEGAIRGYDPVAYFTVGKPTRGADEFTAEHHGAVYKFASAANRDQFLADPEKYAPKYGGFCAFAAAKGSKVPTDPTAWGIVDGRLYLNYNAGVQKMWQADTAGYIAKADKLWPTIR